jgi:hypothetical protein
MRTWLATQQMQEGEKGRNDDSEKRVPFSVSRCRGELLRAGIDQWKGSYGRW